MHNLIAECALFDSSCELQPWEHASCSCDRVLVCTLCGTNGTLRISFRAELLPWGTQLPDNTGRISHTDLGRPLRLLALGVRPACRGARRVRRHCRRLEGLLRQADAAKHLHKG